MKTKVTGENLEQIRMTLPLDQAAELIPGCVVWRWRMGTGAYACGTVWPNGRTAICYGGDSVWGERAGTTVETDNGESEVLYED